MKDCEQRGVRDWKIYGTKDCEQRGVWDWKIYENNMPSNISSSAPFRYKTICVRLRIL